MANNPALGVSNLIEGMKYKEGFCSIEVIATLLEQQCYAIKEVFRVYLVAMVVKTKNSDIDFYEHCASKIRKTYIWGPPKIN